MAQLFIVTTPQNSGDGTPLATAFNYTNSNFSELYARAQVNPPISLTGTSSDQPGWYAYDSTYFYYCFGTYDGINPIWAQVLNSSNAYGNATVATFLADFGANTISTTGNITGGYIFGNGSQLTGLAATYGNANVADFLPTYTGNITGDTISLTGNIYANNFIVTVTESVTGNVVAGNLNTTGTVSAAGNVITNQVVTASGDLTLAPVGNVSVANVWINNVQDPVDAQDAATKNYVDNSLSSVLTLEDDNTNSYAVAAGDTVTFNQITDQTSVVVGTANITFGLANNVSITGNVTANGLFNESGNLYLSANTAESWATWQINNDSVSYAGSNNSALVVPLSDDAHIGEIFFQGDTGNAQMFWAGANNDPFSNAFNILSDLGNIQLYTVDSGSGLHELVFNTQGNLTVSGNIAAAGSIGGSYVFGNGSFLTGLAATYSNADAVAYGEAGWGGNIIPSANVTYSLGNSTNWWDTAWFGANTVYIGGTGVSVANSTLTVGGNPVVTANATGTSSVTGNTAITGNVTGGNILTGGYVSATGNVTGGNLYIDGSATVAGNLQVQGNVTFINSNVITTNDLYIELANNQSTYANINGAGLAVGPTSSPLTYWQYNTSANAWTTNVAVSVLGTVTGASLVGTIATASQTNITAIGTLTSLSVSGNINGGGNLVFDNASSNLTVHDGFFGGVVSATGNLRGGNINTLGLVTATGNITGGNVLSDGVVCASGNVRGANINTLGLITATGTITGGNILTGGDISATGNVYNGSLGVGTAASGTPGEIRATDNITAYYSSDARLKENVQNIADPVPKLMQLNGVEFDWRQDYIDSHGGEDGYFVRRHDIGVIAQELEAVLPELVVDRADGYKAVKYDRIIALLIEAVKAQQREIDELKRR